MSGWPALFGALGLVAILFALVSFFLGLFGAWTDLGWIVANGVVGLLLLGGSIALSAGSLRERMVSGEGRRIGKYGSSAVAQTVLAMAILGALGFLAARHPVRWDWSEAKLHSLSDQTKKVLASLERDVEAVGFFPPLDTAQVRELLERYAYETDRFRFELYDPNSRPDLIERYEIDRRQLARGLVRIALGDEAIEVEEVAEEKITNALLQLSRTTEKKVYFLEGHNERPVEGEAAEEKEGLSRAADALRNENYRFETLLLATHGDVPDDADLVTIAGATRSFSPAEHGALDRYLDRGGSLLVLLDPRANTDLADDLARWGVDVVEDVVVDRVQGLFGQAMSPFARSYGDHPITEGLSEVTLFHVARTVKPRPEAEGRFTELVYTSENSWGERNLELLFGRGVAEFGADDQRGPVPVAVAGTPQLAEDGAEQEEVEARLVVFGDSDFAANGLIDGYRNRDLFVNAVNWLLGDVEAISIRPVRSRSSRLQLSTEQFHQIRYLCLFVLPEAIALVGVLAWWLRRRAPGR
jgi:ABC-type uncharacterized transport system involved in gliding motility auxiliary subunit